MNTDLIQVNFKNDLELITGSFKNAAMWILFLIKNNQDKYPQIVSHINVYNYNRMQKEPELAEMMKLNNNLIFDGIGLKIAAMILGYGKLPDLNGTDLFPLVMKEAEAEKLSMYCLGAEKSVVAKAVENIKTNYPGIIITGYRSGYFEKEEEENIVAEINNSKAQILLNGRNFLMQEDFAIKYRHKLNVSLIWNVGGLYNFISGEVPRAPYFLRRLRLEWLFRFLIEPRRMWYRNIIAAPTFLMSIAAFRLRNFKQRNNFVKAKTVNPTIQKLDIEQQEK